MLLDDLREPCEGAASTSPNQASPLQLPSGPASAPVLEHDLQVVESAVERRWFVRIESDGTIVASDPWDAQTDGFGIECRRCGQQFTVTEADGASVAFCWPGTTPSEPVLNCADSRSSGTDDDLSATAVAQPLALGPDTFGKDSTVGDAAEAAIQQAELEELLAEEAAFFDDDGNPTVETWQRVDDYLSRAEGMAFDNCHKVYILMDSQQVEFQRSLGGGVSAPDAELVRQWYADSCEMRFIQAVSTIDGDPQGPNANDGFTRLIPQHF